MAHQERAEHRLQLGELGKHLAHDGVQLLEHGDGLPRILRGAQQGTGVDLADLSRPTSGERRAAFRASRAMMSADSAMGRFHLSVRFAVDLGCPERENSLTACSISRL